MSHERETSAASVQLTTTSGQRGLVTFSITPSWLKAPLPLAGERWTAETEKALQKKRQRMLAATELLLESLAPREGMKHTFLWGLSWAGGELFVSFAVPEAQIPDTTVEFVQALRAAVERIDELL